MTQSNEEPSAQYPESTAPGGVPSSEEIDAGESVNDDLPETAGHVPARGRDPRVAAVIARLLSDSSEIARQLINGPHVDPDIPDDPSLRE